MRENAICEYFFILFIFGLRDELLNKLYELSACALVTVTVVKR